MLVELYLAYEAQLKTIINPKTGEHYFKHFDLWNQNVEFIEQEREFLTPALFFEFAPIQWRTLGNKVQDADLTIRFHIVHEWFGETAENTPELIRQKRLEYLLAPSLVVQTLQGFATPYTNGLMRTQSIVTLIQKRYVDSVEEYVCRLQDTSAVIEFDPVMAKPIIRGIEN